MKKLLDLQKKYARCIVLRKSLCVGFGGGEDGE